MFLHWATDQNSARTEMSAMEPQLVFPLLLLFFPLIPGISFGRMGYKGCDTSVLPKDPVFQDIWENF